MKKIKGFNSLGKRVAKMAKAVKYKKKMKSLNRAGGGIVGKTIKEASKALKKTKKTGGKNTSGNFPTQKKGVIANKFKVTEGSRLDPDTGGSVDIGRQVGTRGEKVTGVNKPGARGNNFLKDQQTPATRKRAARTVSLEKKKKEGTLTAKERVELSNINKADIEAFKRQTGQTIKGKQNRYDAAKKRKKPKVDDVDHLIQTGEIRPGFNPTPNQIKIAIRNAQARNDTIDVRKLKAKLEMLEPTTPGNTAIKGYSGNTGKPKANLNSGKNKKPREFKNRAEERKAGGPVIKRKLGTKIGKPKVKEVIPSWMKGLSPKQIQEIKGGPLPSGYRSGSKQKKKKKKNIQMADVKVKKIPTVPMDPSLSATFRKGGKGGTKSRQPKKFIRKTGGVVKRKSGGSVGTRFVADCYK